MRAVSRSLRWILTARGRVVKDASSSLALQVAPNQSFAIIPNDLSKGLETLAGTATEVTIRGQVYKKPAGKEESRTSASVEASDSRSAE
jgi:hypothetical protein